MWLNPKVRQELVTHMGMVHRMVVDACSDYFSQMRRRVYQTPRSFLAFLSSYKVSPATGNR